MVSPSVSPQLTTPHPIPQSLPHLTQVLPDELQAANLVKLNQLGQNLSLPQAQEIICRFFLDLVNQCEPESVLQKFKDLFIQPTPAVNSIPRQALEQIASLDHEETYIRALKRSIYILVNNWSATRQHQYVQELVQLLSQSLDNPRTCSVILKRLKVWRGNFVHSQDYKELKIFISKYDNQNHWSDRYSSYLLVEQSIDARKPRQQREAARIRYEQLKEQFKFDLARYTARSPLAASQDSASANPTLLGDEVVHLIQKILQKRGSFSYSSLANIFLNQTQQLCYQDFKQSLLKYLLFSLDNEDLANTIKSQLGKQLELLYETHHEKEWDNHLLLRTCNWIIEYLTTANQKNPSSLFILLATKDNALTLAMLLVKIVLICPATRIHLECCLAKLVQHYESQPESECQWLINFLDVFKVTLTIYTENVHFNLVNIAENNHNAYRVFSQIKNEGRVA